MIGQVVGSGLIHANDGNYYRFSDLNFVVGQNVEFIPNEGLATQIKIFKGEIKNQKNIKNPFENFNIRDKIKNLKLINKSDIKTAPKKSKKSLNIPKFKLSAFKKPESKKPTNINNTQTEKQIFQIKEYDIEEKEHSNGFFEIPVFDLKKNEVSSQNKESNNAKVKEENSVEISNDEIKLPPFKTLKTNQVKSPKKYSKELKIAKILAIGGVLMFMASFVIFAIYKDKALNQATFCFALLAILYIIMTYKSLFIVGEMAKSKDLARNFLKSLFYPAILAFVLAFTIGFGSAFLDEFSIKEQFYIISLATLIAIICWIIYFISINKKVYITLSRITKIELFRVYMILYIISNITISLIFIITSHPEWIILISPNLINIILGFTLIINLAILGVTIAMYIVYIIAWIKVKEIRKIWL